MIPRGAWREEDEMAAVWAISVRLYATERDLPQAILSTVDDSVQV